LANQQAQLAELYQQHRQGLYTLALSITRNPHRAEDAVQDAFVRLYRRHRPAVGDPASYVFMAVRNASIDQIRKRKRDQRAASCIYEDAAPAEGPRDGPGSTAPPNRKPRPWTRSDTKRSRLRSTRSRSSKAK
jgi:RNA polymerase sigma factor (sigma-70 family)